MVAFFRAFESLCVYVEVDDESLYEVDFSKTHGLTQGDEFSLILINSFYGFIFFYSFVN